MTAHRPQFDHQLIRAAVIGVRQFDRQFVSTLLAISSAAAKRRLERLEQRGLVKARNALVSRPPEVTAPLCVWRPGEPIPNVGHIAYAARRRWKDLPVEIIRVYHATNRCRALLGREPIKSPNTNHASHDLGLALTWLSFLRKWPLLTQRCWRVEAEYAASRGRCEKVEDAMLIRDSRVLLLVDYAGAYRDDRVAALLDHAQLHQVPIAIY